MAKRKIRRYLRHAILKKEKSVPNRLCLKSFSLFCPGRFRRLKESLSSPSIGIVSYSDSDDNLYTRLQWGDQWVKYELTKALGQMGCYVTDVDPDIFLHLFGNPTRLPKSAFKIIWIYSHPDMVDPNMLRRYEKVFCLSSSFIRKIKQMGFDAELMIGATARKPVKSKVKYDIVFVGNIRRSLGGRQIIRDLGETSYNLKVWGRGWENVLPGKYCAGQYVENEKLGALYASSLISLNDHYEDMRREGFVSVRIFDILASGGFCISDKNPGIDEIFGDAVPQYESAAHLRELIDFYINHPDERARVMEKGRKIALSHTWTKRAEQFLNSVEELKWANLNHDRP